MTSITYISSTVKTNTSCSTATEPPVGPIQSPGAAAPAIPLVRGPVVPSEVLTTPLDGLGSAYKGWAAEDMTGTGFLPTKTHAACIPGAWLRGLNTGLVVLASVVVLKSAKEYSQIKALDDPDLDDERKRIIGASMSAAAVLLWPVLWDRIIGYSLLTRTPFALIGFGWPMLLTLIDLSYSANSHVTVSTQRAFGLATISADTTTILSLTFSVGLLLTSLGSTKKSSASVNLLFYGLLILAALILPVPALNPRSLSGFAVSTAQRIAINYALGVILSAIALNVTPESGVTLRDAFLSACTKEPTATTVPVSDSASGMPAKMTQAQTAARATCDC